MNNPDTMSTFTFRELLKMRNACYELANFGLHDKALLEVIEKNIKQYVEQSKL